MANSFEELAKARTAALIVAHPDDETLWAGGTVLLLPRIRWTIVTLCRRSDPDRAPRFSDALRALGATGTMADIDDGPEQTPLAQGDVEEAVLSALQGSRSFDLVLTHGPLGEYTRHRRHEETSAAVRTLWQTGKIKSQALWLFAYSDDGGRHPPRAIGSAHRKVNLPRPVYETKKRIISDLYGFLPESFEARAASPVEAFWCFESKVELTRRLAQAGPSQ